MNYAEFSTAAANNNNNDVNAAGGEGAGLGDGGDDDAAGDGGDDADSVFDSNNSFIVSTGLRFRF